MSNQPEEGQNQNFTPPPQETPPPPPQYNPPPGANGPSSNAVPNIPATSYATPEPSYDQPAFYRQPEYANPQQPNYYDPLLNAPGQTPYNYQQSRYSAAFPSFPPSNPLPLGEAIRQLPAQYWRVITRPRIATFDAEQGKAAWNIIWVQIIALAAINAILSILGAAEESSIFGGLGNSSLHSLGLSPIGYALYFLIGVPIGIFIGAGIYFLLAKAFQGQGTFLRYLYCFMLIYVPLTIITNIAGFIPYASSLIKFAIDIYEIVLLIFMTMAVHRLSGKKATLAVFILPIALVILVVISLIFAAILQL